MDAPVSIPEHTRYNGGIGRSVASQVAARDAVLILLRSLQFDPGKAWRAWNHFRALQFDFCCASMLASKLTNMGVLSNKKVRAKVVIKPFGLVSGTVERCKCGIFHLVEPINTAGILRR